MIPREEAEPSDSWEPNKGVICDTLNTPLEHPCNGQMYDSKSAFRATTRAYGCYEYGNDLVGKTKRTGPKDVETFPKDKILRDLWNRL